MSTFDIRTDAPGLLRTEAMNITISFDRTGPTTGRISWNIPSPAAGCAVGQQAYAGMVVTLDTTPASISKVPTNGTVYSADATASAGLFAGDKISTSLVVGAFYDKTTTFFDVVDLLPNTPYYVSGFPCDAQYRYFTQGVHAYSVSMSNKGSPDTHGTQVAVLNVDKQVMGVAPTDSTGLSISTSYTFDIRVGLIPRPARVLSSVECQLVPPTYNITVDGAKAQDFQHLVSEINKQLALATNNVQSPTPPLSGSYYWSADTKQLYLWDGYTSNIQPNVIIQASDPSTVITGTYWYNPTTNALSSWSGSAWVPLSVIQFGIDPTTPQTDATYWYNTTTHHGYLWNGTTWNDTQIYNQSTDPSIVQLPVAGSYWINTSTNVLYRWNASLGMWNPTIAVEYSKDPNTLTTLDYWYNTTTNALYQYGTPTLNAWNIASGVVLAELAPATAFPAVFPTNGYWYNPISKVLNQWDGTTWTVRSVMVFAIDPTVRTTCGLWLNTSSGALSVWDPITLSWVVSASTYTQATDPTTPTAFNDGTLWFNTGSNTLSVWSNQCFNAVTSIQWATDPILVSDGTAWLNTATNVWYVRTGGAWVVAQPTYNTTSPSSLALGTFWVNTTNSSLNMWNGTSWIGLLYSTAPIAPQQGSTWFNTTTDTLMQWDGSSWIVGTPTATCELDCNGNMLFSDTSAGGLSFITLTDVTLFKSLSVRYSFHDSSPGTDGASDQASYEELGIGTDGSIEERLKLHNEIRYELGYPTVDVEISSEQMDYAIDKALGEFRARSSLAYKSGFFFMFVTANTQNYVLTSKISGMNKIVDIQGVYRLTSSFLSSAHGAGVYGQIVLQHMYNMGTFDLLSYHIMGEYTKLMEILFAGRITFTWNEQSRTLHMHNRFPFSERQVAIEATVERTEQDLLVDRYTRVWLRRYALATVRLMLAETRGKFASLPGAGGSITLNAAELRQAAATEIEACLMEIEQYIADKPEEYGKFDFTFG